MANSLTESILVIGSPSEWADCRYASGFAAVDPMVFMRHGGRDYLVVPLLELGRAKQESPRAKVYVPQELGIPKNRRRSVADWALGLARKLRVRRVTVSPMFPAGVLRRLEQGGVRVRLAKAPLFPKRAIKRAGEIEFLREAQRAAVAAVRAAEKVLKESSIRRDGSLRWNRMPLTSEALRRVIDGSLLEHGCMARDTIVAGGSQAADPHDRGHGPLRAGETIVLDIFPQHKTTGYWGDITRTFVKGPASEQLRAMYRAVHAAQAKALGMVCAGVKVRSIHEAVQEVFDKAGFETSLRDGVARGFFHGTGHGVGLEIHESPSVSPNDAVLRAGHVVTIEPGLYYPELGGIRIEDTVAVTKTGFEFLATCPKRFEIP